MTIQFPDVSNYQPSIDWSALRQWTSIVAIKVTEGIGAAYIDASYKSHRGGAEAQNFESIWYYHFAHADLGNSPEAESDWFHSVLGQIRPQDKIFLDFEMESPLANADWALRWLKRAQANFGILPGIYSYLYFVEAHLQNSALSAYPLWLADYGTKPAPPAPWQSGYAAWQYTDVGTVPGVPGDVDVSYYYGGNMGIPTGWHDDGTTLTALNGHKVVQGFRQHILDTPVWNPSNVPLEEEWHKDPLEEGFQQIDNAGQWQTFNYGALAYNQSRGVYTPGLGNEYLFVLHQRDQLKQELAAAQTQITQLQAQLAASSQVNVDQAAQDLHAIQQSATAALTALGK